MHPLDVAIVGAGPAGSWAARALAQSGARVALFDPSHPREKPCGGGLTRRALEFLDRAGIRDQVPGVSVRSARFQSGPFDGAVSTSYPMDEAGDEEPLFVVDRRTLDSALLESAQAAGAELVSERVLDVSVTGARATVRTRTREYESAVVLGADGVNSLVRRRLRAPLGRGQISIATGCYARGVSASEVVVHCVAQPPGYIWSFPRPDHLAIGICAQADRTTAAELQRLALQWTRQAGATRGATLERYSWPIPSLSYVDLRRERPAGERWLLLGDAAGLVDPLTREGIYFALLSGELAAAAIKGQQPVADAYLRRLDDLVFPELAHAAALKARFFTSGFTDLLVDALARSSKVRGIMTDLIAGRQPYATLKRRLLMTFEVGLAWRLLKLQLHGVVGR